MVHVAIVIALLALIGVWCGIMQILDVAGVIHLDEPEYKTTDYCNKKGENNGNNDE
jgi:hypothetical protein